MRRTTIVSALLLAAFLCGCSAPYDNPVVRYSASRGLDFLDIFEVGLEAGPSFRMDAQYGLGIMGIGDHDVWVARLGQRSMIAHSKFYEFAPMPFPVGLPFYWLLSPLEAYAPEKALGEVTHGLQQDTETPKAGLLDCRVAEWCPALYRLGPITYSACGPTGRQLNWDKMFPVGAEVCWLIGARARVYPTQLVDFLGGLFTWDMLGDDVTPHKHVAAGG
jgi:hypothetical protein